MNFTSIWKQKLDWEKKTLKAKGNIDLQCLSLPNTRKRAGTGREGSQWTPNLAPYPAWRGPERRGDFGRYPASEASFTPPPRKSRDSPQRRWHRQWHKTTVYLKIGNKANVPTDYLQPSTLLFLWKRDYTAASFEIKGAHTCINVGERFGVFFLFFGRTFLH